MGRVPRSLPFPRAEPAVRPRVPAAPEASSAPILPQGGGSSRPRDAGRRRREVAPPPHRCGLAADGAGRCPEGSGAPQSWPGACRLPVPDHPGCGGRWEPPDQDNHALAGRALAVFASPSVSPAGPCTYPRIRPHTATGWTPEPRRRGRGAACRHGQDDPPVRRASRPAGELGARYRFFPPAAA